MRITVSLLYNWVFRAVCLVITHCHIDLHSETLYSKFFMKRSEDNGLNCAICIIAISGIKCRCNPFLTVEKNFNLKPHIVCERLLCTNALFAVLASREEMSVD